MFYIRLNELIFNKMKSRQLKTVKIKVERNNLWSDKKVFLDEFIGTKLK